MTVVLTVSFSLPLIFFVLPLIFSSLSRTSSHGAARYQGANMFVRPPATAYIHRCDKMRKTRKLLARLKKDEAAETKLNLAQP